MQYLGHPILNDRLYCPSTIERCLGVDFPYFKPDETDTTPLKLHAYSLRLKHPILDIDMQVDALHENVPAPFKTLSGEYISESLVRNTIDRLGLDDMKDIAI